MGERAVALVPTRQVGQAACAKPLQVPTDELSLDAPPCMQSGFSGVSSLIPLVTIAATSVAGFVIWNGGGFTNQRPMMLMLPLLMIASALGMLMNSGRRRAIVELDEKRQGYLEYLDATALQLEETVDRQRCLSQWRHPHPAALWTLTGTPRLWERRRGHADFLTVRIGTGAQPFCRPIVLRPQSSPEEADPVASDSVARLIRFYATIPGAPLTVELGADPILVVARDLSEGRGFVRALVCQLAVFHRPSDLAIAAVVDSDSRPQWEWLKWLPHNTIPKVSGSRAALMFTSVEDALATVPRPERSRGCADSIVIIDSDVGFRTITDKPSRVVGARIIAVIQDRDGWPSDFSAQTYRLDGGKLVRPVAGLSESDQTEPASDIEATVDTLTLPEAKRCARRLARYRSEGQDADEMASWCAGLGAPNVEAINGERFWTAAELPNRFAVPIGVADSGQLLTLDIREASEGGIGPHGLCIGATGSGKSELLRTVVLGLAAKHSPTDLNFVLIDFKGGATFLGLHRLNHVSAIITNLSVERQLVDRMKDALAGEMHRRQELFRQRKCANLTEYQRLRSTGDAPPLARLVIVVDEFAELLQHHSEFIEIFTAICRVGRSLGMHLLLASQRLEEGRLRGLESHLSYRICLKTLSASESRAAIGVADAVELPGFPGAAYLRTSDGSLTRFQTICVSTGRLLVTRMPANPEETMAAVQPFRWNPVGPKPQRDASVLQRSIFETVIEQLAGRGRPAHAIWLPPLPTSLNLADIQGNLERNLCVVIGVVDRPFQQRRTPLEVNLNGPGGNIAIVGAPQTGKSMTVRTLIAAVAGGHDSRQAQFYCLDFGGGTLASLLEIAHVGAVAGRHDGALVRRMIGEITRLLRWRLAHFAEIRVGSISEYRLRELDVDDASDPYGDVFLVIDGWAAFREEFSEYEQSIAGIATQGLSVGIHLVLTANRWADVRPSLKDLLGSRIELRLGDPLDSEMDRRQATFVPVGTPGRGIASDGSHFAVALAAIPDTCGQPSAPSIRLLPDVVDLHTVQRDSPNLDTAVVLGIGERDLAPVAMDFGRQQHLLVIGDPDCGKTSTLRTLCRGILMQRAAQIVMVDFRRTLLGAFDSENLLGYAFSPDSLAALLPSWLGQLEARLPSAATPLDQLRNGSWWTGPDLFVVVDDYELVSSSSGDPLGQLLKVLPYARDIGLHLAVARRTAGISRAMYDPLLTQLQESNPMALLMSGSPDEGPLFGQWRPTPQPSGRGVLVTRDGDQRVQVGWCDP